MLVKWEDMLGFKWSEPYEDKVFNKGKYYKLIIVLPKFGVWKVIAN